MIKGMKNPERVCGVRRARVWRSSGTSAHMRKGCKQKSYGTGRENRGNQARRVSWRKRTWPTVKSREVWKDQNRKHSSDSKTGDSSETILLGWRRQETGKCWWGNESLNANCSSKKCGNKGWSREDLLPSKREFFPALLALKWDIWCFFCFWT